MIKIDVVEKTPVSIYRNGKLVYSDDPKTTEIVTLFSTNQYKNDEYGTIKIEEWPEGLMFWVGGQIVHKHIT